VNFHPLNSDKTKIKGLDEDKYPNRKVRLSDIILGMRSKKRK